MLKSSLAKLYGFFTRQRNRLFDLGIFAQHKSALPVVSVGNLTAGGNGKTPLVMFLAEKLKQRGYAPCILSRGYGGSTKGPYLIQKTEDAALVGDEPLMMARTVDCPVIIARKRVAGAKFIEKNNLGNCIILDDGFQHRWLSRNADIVCIDVSTSLSRDSFNEGALLPAGLFREEREHGLKRATTVVLADRMLQTKARDADPSILSLLPDTLSVFRSFYSDLQIKAADGSAAKPTEEVVLVTGIANPEGFSKSIEKKGLKILTSFTFPDHHVFTQQNLQGIREEFPAYSVITTQKDIVRIGKIHDTNWFYTEPRFTVFPEDAFVSHIMKLLKR